jgi:hypothetical protein
MAAAALSVPQTSLLPFSKAPIEALSSSELCDELLMHMLDCELCLDPEQPVCGTCQSLQGRIAQQGRPGKGVVFAY